jgi:cytochrome c-type biogenesis protein CcmH
MKTRCLLFALLIVLCAASLLAQSAPDPRQIIGPPAGPPLQGAELDVRAAKVSSVLRCPVCQGLSVQDSPTAMAVNMKHQVREMVAMGYSQEQILTYFEKSYGEFVRLEPALRGLNWLVWLGPLFLAIGGGYGVWRFLKKSSAAAHDPAISEATADRDALPDDPELASWVLRARELAYGWPGGVSPQKRAVTTTGE